MRAALIRSQIDRLHEQLQRLEVFGSDDFDDETVLVYRREGMTPRGLMLLTYAAIKKDGRWWVTDGHNRPLSWEQLCDRMTDSPEVWLATEWEAIV